MVTERLNLRFKKSTLKRVNTSVQFSIPILIVDVKYLTSPIPGYCGWNDTSKGAFDWKRDRGGTPSSNTGPTVDHTLGKCFNISLSVVVYTAGERKQPSNLFLILILLHELFCLLVSKVKAVRYF